MSDAIAPVERALANHLASALPSALGLTKSAIDLAQRIERGWNSTEQEMLEPFDALEIDPKRVIVNVHQRSAAARRSFAPDVYSTTVPDPQQPDINVLVDRGELEIPLEVSIWAKSDFEREEILTPIMAALQVGPLESGQLELTLPDYHGVTATYAIDDGGDHEDRPDMIQGAWWVYSLEVTAEVTEIVSISMKRLLELRFGVAIEPPDGAAAETVTVFKPA